jgi:hypothetical protein
MLEARFRSGFRIRRTIKQGLREYPESRAGARARLVADIADMRDGERIANQLEAAGARLAVQTGVHACAIHERLGEVDCGGLRAGIAKRGSSLILRTVGRCV